MSSRSSLEKVFEGMLEDPSRIFLLDGGTGEELFLHGVPDDRKIWSATAVVNEKYHSTLKQVHRSFLDAGADAITTNSYGIVPGVGFSESDILSYCGIAGQIARQVVESYPGKYVLGSLGPLVESYRPDLIMAHDKGVSFYSIMIRALGTHVDAFLAETMSSAEESMQVIAALSQSNQCCNIPMLVSFSLDSNGKLRNGETAMATVCKVLEYARKENDTNVAAILFNCSEPEAISIALQDMNRDAATINLLKSSKCLVGAYANCLTPVPPNWTMATSQEAQPMRTDLGPVKYSVEFARPWHKDFHAQLLGGCCGITPSHIAALNAELK